MIAGLELWLPALLLWQAALPKRLTPLRWACTIFAVLLFATHGARYRILLLLGGSYILRNLQRKTQPNLLTLVVLVVSGVVLFTWIGDYRWLVRMYSETGQSGMMESLMRHFRLIEPFIAVTQYVPENSGYELGGSFLYALTLAIPRSIWPAKPTPAFRQVIEQAMGTRFAYDSGLFYPNFGEYYQNFGLIGIVLGMLLFGVTCRWLYFRLRASSSQAAICAYSLFLPYLVQFISRGYFAQQVQTVTFIFFPLLLSAVVSKTRKISYRSGGF